MSPTFRSFLLSTVVLLLLFLPASPATAQSAGDTTAHVRPPAFQEGGWGMQFEATSLDGGLSGFQGSLFSGRYHLSGRQALRVGISVNASTEDENEVEESHRDTLAMDRSERRSEEDFQDYTLSVEYVHYVRPTDRVFVYAGADREWATTGPVRRKRFPINEGSGVRRMSWNGRGTESD